MWYFCTYNVTPYGECLSMSAYMNLPHLCFQVAGMGPHLHFPRHDLEPKLITRLHSPRPNDLF